MIDDQLIDIGHAKAHMRPVEIGHNCMSRFHRGLHLIKRNATFCILAESISEALTRIKAGRHRR
jgi:hypothetical protein